MYNKLDFSRCFNYIVSYRPIMPAPKNRSTSKNGFYQSVCLDLIDLGTNLEIYVEVNRHMIVATRFCFRRSDETYLIDHFDGIKGNDIYTNLRWVTPKENNWRNNPNRKPPIK